MVSPFVADKVLSALRRNTLAVLDHACKHIAGVLDYYSMNETQIAEMLGPKLKKAREKLAYSQMGLAELVSKNGGGKCQPSDISRYEAGKILPGWSRFFALCKILKLDKRALIMDMARAAARRRVQGD